MEGDLEFFLMEDYLNSFENGRLPYLYQIKTIFIFQKKDDLNILKNGRRPQTYQKWRKNPGNLTNTTTKSKLVQLKKIDLNWL